MVSHHSKIVIAEADGYSAEAFALYAQAGQVETFISPLDKEFSRALASATVLVVRLATVWNASTLCHAQQLQYIITPTTGLDHIDLQYCASRKIQVLSLYGESQFLDSIPSTAEHTWALILAAVKRVVPSAQEVLTGEWKRDHWKGHNLQGKTIGIIGAGRVGRQVASFAAAFGMQCIAYDVNPDAVKLINAEAVPLINLLQASDVISIHIPGAGNDDFLSATRLQHCKRGSVLVNTSRGNVWNEHAVASLIEQGVLMAVATDVLHHELTGRIQESPLWQLALRNSRVLITPHIAGATYESMAATEVFMARKFLQALGL